MWAARGSAGGAGCSSGGLPRDASRRGRSPAGNARDRHRAQLGRPGRQLSGRRALGPAETHSCERRPVAVSAAAPTNGHPEPDTHKARPAVSAIANGAESQELRKARMYLMRSDGLTCTREIVEDSQLRVSFPSTQQQLLVWRDRPRTVLVLKKLGDDLMPHLARTCKYLKSEGITPIVEPHDRERLLQVQRRPRDYDWVQTFDKTSELPDIVDFIVCLGGDGVILHAASLFRTCPVPPVISFHLGSLGFLTNHSFLDYKSVLHGIICGEKRLEACSYPMSSNDFVASFEESPQGPVGVYVTLRMRLSCEIYRNGKKMPGGRFEVMNEIVVDRGSNPFLTKIEAYEKGTLFTKVQADGVMLATPTGSTAYSVAAGGSMVHPNISAILFTPVCPHSLSFRPIVMPDYAEIELRIPQDARCTAWVCFDGKARQELMRGDSIIIKMSQHPVPTINAEDQTTDWFNSLERCLSWNERAEQGSLELESDLSLDLATLSVSESLDMDWGSVSVDELPAVDPLKNTQ